MKNTSPQTLYIIGNGFDLYHDLDTWYSSFGLFLRDNYSSIYEYFLNYFGLPELDEDDEDSLKDPLWSHFEESLASLDIDLIIEEHSEYAANPASDEHSDGDWDTIAVYVGEIRGDLTIKLLEVFKEFIRNVQYPCKGEISLLNIDNSAIYFNFNYTETLELYYQIDPSQILYIHNKAESNEKLVLGHGIDPNEFERKVAIPSDDLKDEELDQWREAQADSYDLSIERGRDELIKYFADSFKATSLLINKNESFFKSLNSINKVYVLGHSLADVDSDYFKKILESINNDIIIWYVSYRKADEITERKDKLLNLGLLEKQIQFIKMDEM